MRSKYVGQSERTRTVRASANVELRNQGVRAGRWEEPQRSGGGYSRNPLTHIDTHARDDILAATGRSVCLFSYRTGDQILDDRPALRDVIAAKGRIAPFVDPTPLHHYLSLDKLLDAEVHVKHENHNIIGAFKVRGGVNLVSQLSDDDKRRGVISASTGNHGQAMAYSAGIFGAKAIIVVPEDANPGKVESMRNLGAKVIFHGRDFDDAREHVERLSKEEGYRYIHSANEPMLIAGAGDPQP